MKLKRKLNTGIVFVLLISFVLMNSCKSKNGNQNSRKDTPWQGTINISADESFKPVVDELVKVYESNRPKTKINVQYKPEAACFQDFLVDSIRMIIATRRYNEEEKELMSDSLNVAPSSLVVARDAIAVIVNPSSPDSLFTLKDLKEILTGKFKKN
jgi:phosphate transport system substrate-binding protein